MAVTLDVEKYYRLRERVMAEPQSRDALHRVAARVYRGAHDGDLRKLAWAYFGDKPLFAWGNAVNKYEPMWNSGKFFPSALDMAGPDWEIQYKRRAKFWNSTANYTATGPAVIAFRAAAGQVVSHTGGDFKRPQVSLQRLATMRKLATGIARSGFFEAQPGQASPAARQLAALARRPDAQGIVDAVKPIQAALGGIGFTTVCHSLADFGAEVIKPDMHAARALLYFGDINGGQGWEDPNGYLAESDWHKAKVVEVAVRLASQVQPLPVFGNKVCREVDGVLLWGSRAGHMFKL